MMKLITFPLAPNGKRVEMFIAEKGITNIETEYIGMDPSSLKKLKPFNPLAQVPILEIDKNNYLSESTAICLYIELIHPVNNLLGNSPIEKAKIEMWQRRVELGFFIPVVEYGHHAHPFFKDSFHQIAEFGEFYKTKISHSLELLNEQLNKNEFIAGDQFSIADITAYSGIQLARIYKFDTLEKSAISEWILRIDKRPSSEFSRYSF